MAKKSAANKLVSVILDSDVPGLGTKGVVVSVKPSYAENVLVRQNLGVFATPADLERIAAEQADAAAAAAAAKKKAEGVRDSIQEKYGKGGLVMEVQVDADGAPREAITSADVVEMLKHVVGVTVAAEEVSMPELAEIGSVVAELKLHPEVSTSLKIVAEKSKITFS